MDKKTIALIVACVLLLLFWGKVTEFLGLSKPAPPPTQPPVTTDTTIVASQDSIIAQHTTPVMKIEIPILPSGQPVLEKTPEKIVTVTTPLFTLNFTNRGGGLNKIVFQKYGYRDNGNVILAEATDNIVPEFISQDGQFRTFQYLFDTDKGNIILNSGDSPAQIIYTYINEAGGRIIKTYTISADAYDIGFKLTVEGIETFGFERYYHLAWGITPAPTEIDVKDDYSYFKVVAMQAGDKYEFDDYDNRRMGLDKEGSTTWAGLRTKYFSATMIPRSRLGDGILATGEKIPTLINGKEVEVRRLVAGIKMQIPSQGMVTDSFTIYAGPIEYGTLKRYNVGLEELTSLGWVIIKPFSIAIIWLLPKIYQFLPNYGVVVLIFSLLIKLITFPLSRKQAIAMTRMKDLQPKMKALQEKYKTDAARLNKEMMKLYKEAGANPLSGCLPMLPQMPLFFALFTVFKTTIEFRGAYFVGWITDLSVPDPYYILPIIMTVSMFVQQKMTMTDPKNKMLVYLMPLIFGWLFMNFPAGLVLYWTGFNILSFAETMYVRNRIEKNPQVKDA